MNGFAATLMFALCPAIGLCGEISVGDLASLPAHDVVILGEVHDNTATHVNQAAAVAGLKPKALVFEMLTPEQAARVTPTNRLSLPELRAVLAWEEGGWPDFGLYYPIFTAAPNAVILGAALPRDSVRQAVSDGAAAVFGADAAQYGLDRALPADDQALRAQDQMQAHCNALPQEMLAGMVEAQRLRDAALARAAVQGLALAGGPVVVITGTGHARRDWGVPAAISAAAPDISVLAVGQLESDPGPDAPYDLWIVTDPAPREDPCAAFKVNGG